MPKFSSLPIVARRQDQGSIPCRSNAVLCCREGTSGSSRNEAKGKVSLRGAVAITVFLGDRVFKRTLDQRTVFNLTVPKEQK